MLTEGEKPKEINYQENLKPYKNGRILNEYDLKILKILVDARLAINDVLIEECKKKTILAEEVSRCHRLIGDLQIIQHIWKKADDAT